LIINYKLKTKMPAPTYDPSDEDPICRPIENPMYAETNDPCSVHGCQSRRIICYRRCLRHEELQYCGINLCNIVCDIGTRCSRHTLCLENGCTSYRAPGYSKCLRHENIQYCGVDGCDILCSIGKSCRAHRSRT